MKLAHKNGVVSVVVGKPDDLLTQSFQSRYYQLIDELQGLVTSVEDVMADPLTRRHWPAVAKVLAETKKLSTTITHRVTRAQLQLSIEVAHA